MCLQMCSYILYSGFLEGNNIPCEILLTYVHTYTHVSAASKSETNLAWYRYGILTWVLHYIRNTLINCLIRVGLTTNGVLANLGHTFCLCDG